MSDIDSTPDTPATIGDRLGWFRGDVAARLVDLAAGQLALRGTPEATLRDLAIGLEPLANIAADLDEGSGPRLYTLLAAMASRLDSIDTRLSAIRDDVNAIKSDQGTGATGYLSANTTRGLLWQILGALAGAQIEPGSLDTGQSGTAISAGRRWATWADTVYYDALAEPYSPPNSRVSRASWATWEWYAASNAASVRLRIDPDNVEIEYPPNRWAPIPAAADGDAVGWSVPEGNTLAVTLRRPAELRPSFVSNPFNINTLAANGVSGQRLQDAFNVQFQSTITFPNNNIGTTTPPSIILGNPQGWVFRVITSGNVLFVWKGTAANVGGDANTIPLPLNQDVTIGNIGVQCWYLQGDVPFTVQILPV